MHLASVFNVILIFLLWYLIGVVSWLVYLFVLCIHSIILSFNLFGVYNPGPCGGEVGFCNLVPAVIVENLLWSTLFLVGVLNVLT